MGSCIVGNVGSKLWKAVLVQDCSPMTMLGALWKVQNQMIKIERYGVFWRQHYLGFYLPLMLIDKLGDTIWTSSNDK